MTGKSVYLGGRCAVAGKQQFEGVLRGELTGEGICGKMKVPGWKVPRDAAVLR